MSNIATEKTTKAEFDKDYANYPDTQPKGFEPFHRNRVDPIYCEIEPGSKVLDIGCNSGEFIKLLKDEKNCDVIGVDVSEPVLELARQKGLTVLKGDAEALPFEDATFDYVTLMEVLVHLHDPIKAIKEIRRVLKPKGVLLGSAPHANLEKYIWDDKRLHRRYYDAESLENDLSTAFDRMYVKTLNGAQFSVGFASSFLASEPAELLFKCGGKTTEGWEAGLFKKSKILRAYFGFTQNAGDVYFRMSGYADKMRNMGAEIAYEPFDFNRPESCQEWQVRVCPSAKDPTRPASMATVDDLDKLIKVADVSVFQITQFRGVIAFFMAAKAVHKKPLVTETDDWVFDIPSSNVAAGMYKPASEFERVAYKQLEISDYIICSTEFIAKSLQEMFPEKGIFIVPNSIDFNIYDNLQPFETIEKKKEGVIRIGYTGCGNHSGDLETIKKPMLALLDEFPNIEFVFPIPFESLGDIKDPRVIVANKWFSIPSYPHAIKGWDLDIGIAPLRDNNFNRAKSNLRWLEYGALKLPTVASKIEPFAKSIVHGRDGFLCESNNDWYENLKRLIVDQGERERVGQNAYRRIKRDFNMDKTAAMYLKILKRIKRESLRT